MPPVPQNFHLAPIAMMQKICYKRVEPASILTPMQLILLFFLTSPIEIILIICYNISNIADERQQCIHHD